MGPWWLLAADRRGLSPDKARAVLVAVSPWQQSSCWGAGTRHPEEVEAGLGA